MAIGYDDTIPAFTPSLTGYSSISTVQEQISRIEGFNAYLCRGTSTIVTAAKLQDDLKYDRWSKAAPGNMTLQHWFETRASKVLGKKYWLLVVDSHDQFVPWNSYLSDVRKEYQYELLSTPPRRRSEYPMSLAYNIPGVRVRARIHCASKDMAAKLRLHLAENDYSLDLNSGEEKVSTGSWWWQHKMVPYFTLDYEIRIRGFKRQVDGIEKKMHDTFTKYGSKFSPDSIHVSSWPERGWG